MLRVTQDHWKRNHWIDHTQLTISRVIYLTVNIIVTLKCGLEVLKVIEIGTIRKLGFSFIFAFHSNYGAILYRLRDVATY